MWAANKYTILLFILGMTGTVSGYFYLKLQDAELAEEVFLLGFFAVLFICWLFSYLMARHSLYLAHLQAEYKQREIE